MALRMARSSACRHTNETLRAAVALWCADRAAAIARYGHIGDWDTRGVTDMSELFADQAGFNDNINLWNVSKVTTMRYVGNAHLRLRL